MNNPTSKTEARPYRLARTEGFEYSGTYWVLDPTTGDRLGSVRRAYRGGGATWKYQPCMGGVPVDEPHRSLKRAAIEVVRRAAARKAVA